MVKQLNALFFLLCLAGCSPRSGQQPSGCQQDTCDGCCLNEQCISVAEISDTQCGRGGVRCFNCTGSGTQCNQTTGTCLQLSNGTCGPQTCGGCCNTQMNMCEQGLVASSCGYGGQACRACESGQTCTVGSETGGRCTAAGEPTPVPAPATGVCAVQTCVSKCYITDTDSAVEHCPYGSVSVTSCGQTGTSATYKKDIDKKNCYHCVGPQVAAAAGYLAGWMLADDPSKCGSSTPNGATSCSLQTLGQSCTAGTLSGKCAKLTTTEPVCCTACVNSAGTCISEGKPCGDGTTCSQKQCEAVYAVSIKQIKWAGPTCYMAQQCKFKIVAMINTHQATYGSTIWNADIAFVIPDGQLVFKLTTEELATHPLAIFVTVFEDTTSTTVHAGQKVTSALGDQFFKNFTPTGKVDMMTINVSTL